MEHAMDVIEDWEIIQACFNQDYLPLDPTNQTPLEEGQQNNTIYSSPLLDHYKEPEQLRHNNLLQPDREPESSETEGEGIISDQESNLVGEEATDRKKPWPVVWWKSQLDNIFKYFGVVGMSCKPFWCMSVVAAMISFVVLRKRVYGTKRKVRAVDFSGKKEIQFVVSTVQLNQSLPVVRRIPVIKVLSPGGDANPWAIVQVKQTRDMLIAI